MSQKKLTQIHILQTKRQENTDDHKDFIQQTLGCWSRLRTQRKLCIQISKIKMHCSIQYLISSQNQKVLTATQPSSKMIVTCKTNKTDSTKKLTPHLVVNVSQSGWHKKERRWKWPILIQSRTHVASKGVGSLAPRCT